MNTHPHVTVATIIQRNGQYLMVEEMDHGRLVVNQPAGHLELGESLQEAAIRETREETAWEVELQDGVGLYVYRSPASQVTYVRVAFRALPVRHLDLPLDEDIERARWMTLDEIRMERQRSPIVLKCLEDEAAGHRIPLSHIQQLG